MDFINSFIQFGVQLAQGITGAAGEAEASGILAVIAKIFSGFDFGALISNIMAIFG
ncbi:MAG: hypothetical protein K6B52_02700 [Clostridiales bacterium]|nr:hypothetical protein [Clostridiales bacterium]